MAGPDFSALVNPASSLVPSGNQTSPSPAPASAPAQANAPAPDPHARLKSMIGGMFLGMDAFGKSIATGGREGGVTEVLDQQRKDKELQLQQQRADLEKRETESRINMQNAQTNMSTAQLQILQHNAPAEHQKLVLENQSSVVKMLTELGIPSSLIVPMIEGDTTDSHMEALSAKAGGDFVNNAIVPVHDEKFAGGGNSYGFDFSKLRTTMVPMDKASPMLSSLQNTIDVAKGILGADDPTVKVAQGRLDFFRQGQSVNAADLLSFNQMVLAQVMGRVQAKGQIQEFQTKQETLKKAQQETDPLFKLENDPNQMAGEKSSAAIPLLQNKISNPATSPQDKVRATRLLAQAQSAHQRFIGDKVAQANAEQQAKQGDPKAAGQLLANGDLTLADMKTRGMTPKFIMDAVNSAKSIKPSYNPADETIAEQQAKSGNAQQFFGSANSLISKGGTLDQLKEAGEKLPDLRLPIFNSVADYMAAASGGKSVPGYTATLIGVSDDYAKVMGGGQGSDTSRMMVYNSFAQKFNQGQRQEAIDAARRAVNSQVEGRIGKNQFMKRQFGWALPQEFDPNKLPDAK